MTTPAGAVAGNAQGAQDDAHRRERKPGDSVFSRKYGPLPGWGWAAVAGVAAIGFFWWHNRSKAQAAQGGTATDTGTGATSDGGASTPDAAAALQQEIDALQGQLATDATEDSGDVDKDTDQDRKKPVPKVTGMRVDTARPKLKAAGFRSTLSERRKPGVAYKVRSQAPAAGTKADPGETVVELHIERADVDRRPNPGGPRR